MVISIAADIDFASIDGSLEALITLSIACGIMQHVADNRMVVEAIKRAGVMWFIMAKGLLQSLPDDVVKPFANIWLMQIRRAIDLNDDCGRVNYCLRCWPTLVDEFVPGYTHTLLEYCIRHNKPSAMRALLEHNPSLMHRFKFGESQSQRKMRSLLNSAIKNRALLLLRDDDIKGLRSLLEYYPWLKNEEDLIEPNHSFLFESIMIGSQAGIELFIDDRWVDKHFQGKNILQWAAEMDTPLEACKILAGTVFSVMSSAVRSGVIPRIEKYLKITKEAVTLLPDISSVCNFGCLVYEINKYISRANDHLSEDVSALKCVLTLIDIVGLDPINHRLLHDIRKKIPDDMLLQLGLKQCALLAAVEWNPVSMCVSEFGDRVHDHIEYYQVNGNLSPELLCNLKSMILKDKFRDITWMDIWRRLGEEDNATTLRKLFVPTRVQIPLPKDVADNIPLNNLSSYDLRMITRKCEDSKLHKTEFVSAFELVVDQEYKAAFSQDCLQEWMLQYSKWRHCRAFFWLTATRGAKDLARLTHSLSKVSTSLSNDECDRLFAIVCARKNRLQAHPGRDYFHQPYKQTNQIYWKIIMRLCQRGYDIKKMLPAYPNTSGDGGRDHTYLDAFSHSDVRIEDVSPDDLVVLPMQRGDTQPVIYLKSDLLTSYRVNGGRIEHTGTTTDNAGRYFSQTEIRSLFINELGFVSMAKKLHQEEVAGRAGAECVPSSLLDILYSFGKRCWDNSTDSEGTFSQGLAERYALKLSEDLEPYSDAIKTLQRTRVYVPAKRSMQTYDDLFSSMTYDGCSGQLGKAVMQYVNGVGRLYEERASSSPYATHRFFDRFPSERLSLIDRPGFAP